MLKTSLHTPLTLTFFALSVACGGTGEVGTSISSELTTVSEGAAYLTVTEDDDALAEDGVAGMDDTALDDMADEISDDVVDAPVTDEEASPCDFGARRARIRAHFDADGDGALSPEELQALQDAIEDREARRPRLAELVQRRRHRVFHRARWAFDANSDGVLGPREREAFVEALQGRCEARRDARLAEFDANGNGQLDPAELRAAREARQAAAQARLQALLDTYDANENGRLDPEERRAWKRDLVERFRARRQALIEQFDADEDGTLDAQELARLKAAIRDRFTD